MEIAENIIFGLIVIVSIVLACMSFAIVLMPEDRSIKEENTCINAIFWTLIILDIVFILIYVKLNKM